MSTPQLKKNILATVAYYDGLNYPLSAFEIWKHLIEAGIPKFKNKNSEFKTQDNLSFSLREIITELENGDLQKHIGELRGFYFLRGRRELAARRIKCDKISAAKIKKLKRVVWWLRFVPFVRFIGATGTLGMKNAEEESDWDVLVILKEKKIWTGRTLLTAFLHLVRKRRHGSKTKDRVCLNYFITDNHLELTAREIEPFFQANEIMFMIPIFDVGIFRDFCCRNDWVKNFKPNWNPDDTSASRALGDSRWSCWLRKAGEKILNRDWLEDKLEKWQQEKIRCNPKTTLPGSYIKASRKQLIFLPKPQGPRIMKAMEEKLEKMENTRINFRKTGD